MSNNINTSTNNGIGGSAIKFSQSKIPSVTSSAQVNKNRTKAKTTYNQASIINKSTTQSSQTKAGAAVISNAVKNQSNEQQAQSQEKNTIVSPPITKGNTFYSPRLITKPKISAALSEEEGKSVLILEEQNSQTIKQKQSGLLKPLQQAQQQQNNNERDNSELSQTHIEAKHQKLVNQSSGASNIGVGSSNLSHQNGQSKQADNSIKQNSIVKTGLVAQQKLIGLKAPTKLQNNTLNTAAKQVSQQQSAEKSQQSSAQKREIEQQQVNQEQRLNPDEDEFIDDMLDDSMELHESNTLATSAQSKSKTSSVVSNQKQLNQNNKINTTSPSKLNSKFQSNAKQQLQNPPVQNKQQNIKQSAITGKKTLQSLMQEKDNIQISKPNSQLDLNLSNSNLNQVKVELLSNTGLRSIDLRNNRIIEQGLPEELFKLEHLWKLQIDNNLLSSLPDYFDSLIGLRQLTLSNNQLESLPTSLFRVKNLEKLDITNNKIIEIHSDIGLLSNLKYLYLCENQIVSLPKTFGNLVNLQHLALEWCQYLRPSFEKLIKKSVQTNQNSSQEESIIQNFILTFHQFTMNPDEVENQHQINFLEFMRIYYKQRDIKQLLNKFSLHKKTSILHYICKYQHTHLFDLFKLYKDFVNINTEDEFGETPLMCVLNEKASELVDKILRDYKDQLILNDYNETNQDQTRDDLTPSKQLRVLHPLMLAVKNIQYETALKILRIMVKAHLKTLDGQVLDLNIKDENKNTLFHYLFLNFSNNMELSVELCQELLKQGERGQKTIPQSVNIKLNEINKQGMTPIDLATEVKQNQAIEFAIYYNKNMLPALQTSKKNAKYRELFDINSNNNQRGVSPLHRAILTNNYKAIYLLLQSGDCNLFIKDKDFRSARDYCQKILFLSKYLRKGESNYLRYFLHKVWREKIQLINGRVGANMRASRQGLKGSSSKPIHHNNLNFFTMISKRGNRIKYNSWYTRHNGVTGLQAISLGGNNNNIALTSSQQPTQEKNIGDDLNGSDVEEEIRIEDIKDDENIDDENVIKIGPQVQSSIINNNRSSKLDDQQKQQNNLNERKAQSILKTDNVNLVIQPQFNDRRLSAQSNKKPSTKPLQQSTTQVKPQPNPSKPGLPAPKPIKGPVDKRLVIQQQQKQPQDNPIFFDLDQSTQLVKAVSTNSNHLLMEKRESDMFFDDEEGVEENEESPQTLPSNKHKYIMAVNNSKISRKPYYKQIQKNRYEREFCILMDPKISLTEKIQKLYQVFAQVQQQIHDPSKEISNSFYRDGREFLGYLKLELESKDENLIPLKNEILYFQEIMFGNQNLNIVLPINEGNQSARKNANNFSLERGFLPSIQETNVENQNNSPVKKPMPNQTKYGFKGSSKPSLVQDQHNKEEEKVQRLQTTSSSKNLDKISLQVKQQQNPNNSVIKSGKTVIEEKKSGQKIIKLKYGLIDDEDKESPSSPIAYSSQANSKLNQSSTSFNISSPIPSTQNLIKSSAQQKTKDSCIKKIEVQIQEKQQNSPQDKSLTNKWKQLTINPNAQQTQNQSSAASKGFAKTTGINAKLASTPQSQKSTPSSNSHQIITLTHNNQNSAINNASIASSSANSTRNQPQTSVVKAGSSSSQQANNKNSSSLSNRSNSNPRHSLINNQAANNSNINNPSAIKTQKKQTTTVLTSSIGKSSTSSYQMNSANKSLIASVAHQNSVANTSTSNIGQSKLKAPSSAKTQISRHSTLVNSSAAGTKLSYKK